MQQLGEIRVSGGAKLMTIDIEGVIGVPEWWQFDGEEQRAATYENFRSQIERIGRSGARKIQVNIRSIGGNVNDALLIYDTLCDLAAEGAQIETSCHGYVASAATVIAQAATTEGRLISSNALYLVHNATTALDGNSIDAQRTARMLDKTDERIAQIYATRSDQPVEQFRELMARDGGRGEWLSPTEVVEAGLADRVVKNSPLAAVRDKVVNTVHNLFDRYGISSNFVPAKPTAEGCQNSTLSQTATTATIATIEPNPVEELGQRIEKENLRMNVKPSVTKPKEDPSVITPGMFGVGLGDGQCSRNGNAYEGDAQQFQMGY